MESLRGAYLAQFCFCFVLTSYLIAQTMNLCIILFADEVLIPQYHGKQVQHQQKNYYYCYYQLYFFFNSLSVSFKPIPNSYFSYINNNLFIRPHNIMLDVLSCYTITMPYYNKTFLDFVLCYVHLARKCGCECIDQQKTTTI